MCLKEINYLCEPHFRHISIRLLYYYGKIHSLLVKKLRLKFVYVVSKPEMHWNMCHLSRTRKFQPYNQIQRLQIPSRSCTYLNHIFLTSIIFEYSRIFSIALAEDNATERDFWRFLRITAFLCIRALSRLLSMTAHSAV